MYVPTGSEVGASVMAGTEALEFEPGPFNLAYLTSEQALADLSNFVTSMNGNYNLTDARD